MSLFEAVMVYILMIIVMSVLRDLYSLILFGFLSSFISLSLVAIFDSSGVFSTTFFTGTTTVLTWIQVLYGTLTMVIFYKAYFVAWRGKQKHISEGG